MDLLRGGGTGLGSGLLGAGECTPGYYNNEGKGFDENSIGLGYPGGALEFFDLMARWRDAGDFDGLETRGA